MPLENTPFHYITAALYLLRNKKFVASNMFISPIFVM